MSRDPVCGMMVDPNTAQYSARYNGRAYYFCHAACKTAFVSDPPAYLKKKGWFTRFLNWIARANDEKFHGHPPDCCNK